MVYPKGAFCDLLTEDGKAVHRAKGYSVDREELEYGPFGIFHRR